MTLDLTVVMPVYNEEECIADVVRSWRDVLSQLGMSFCILVLNDGSKDGTASALKEFEGAGDVQVITKSNSGHGPTILEGYSRAVEMSQWVFQCDSDDEMKPDYFAHLWQKREKYGALFAVRSGREQNRGRSFISAVSRATVRLLFGRGIRDVNVPYRLMRADILRHILPQIPRGTFAPNVIISGALAKGRVRIYNMAVPHESRRTGSVSIVKWKLWKAAALSFFQTIRCRPKLPKSASR